MSQPLLSTAVLLGALILFVSERVRHDLVALLALLACVLLGLTAPSEVFDGFADPAVIAVAAILVVGRAIELSGVAASLSRIIIPRRAGFSFRLAMLLAVGAFLSAFMNNIAALVVTMPIAAEIARDAKRPAAATLMPLAFATILGGMTTLIGTPANLILSSVREKELGQGFGFFQMTPVGVAVSAVGLLYLALIGWRLLPVRRGVDRPARPPWRVYELTAPEALAPETLLPRLRRAEVRLLAMFREGRRIDPHDGIRAGDRLLVLSRHQQWVAAAATELQCDVAPNEPAAVTARMVVAHGSFLIGLSHEAVRIRSDDQLNVVAVGPRAARRRSPLSSLRIEAGDQLFVRGKPEDLADFIGGARLLEIDRLDRVPLARRRAVPIIALFLFAIGAIVGFGVSPALAFVALAVAMAATRLIAPDEIYNAIDWSVIVLLAAMIPVGRSFETSGAAAIAAEWLGATLAGGSPFVVIAALCGMTLLLSIFLNNVATAIIMGPLAIDVAQLLGITPDAALLAVLVGTSADFLTPIGHQNNLLVMGPGGYRFTDYMRMGAILVVLVIGTTAAVLAAP
ncbi:SLC13 family permease [Sphingomonas sp. RS6]